MTANSNTPISAASPEFKTILTELRRGAAVADARLLPFLVLESKDERRHVNLKLAEAYFERCSDGRWDDSLARARSCIDRAWLLSDYSPDVLSRFLEIHRSSGDVASIKEGLKRVGIEHAARGDLGAALGSFDRWAYADAEFLRVDLHAYDPDIISCVDRLAALHRFDTRGRLSAHRPRRLRVAHLMHGLVQHYSSLAKVDRLFARHYDKSRVEVAYFSVDDESAVALSPEGTATIDAIRGFGWDVSVASKTGSVYDQLLAIGIKINDFAPDLLVTSAAFATFKNYFVAALKPAPITLALHQASSPQFTWHTFDHSISWFQMNLVDCPADCSHVPLELEFPDSASISPKLRPELKIPASATVLGSGGRWPKFRDPTFWRAMAAVLRDHDDVYLLLMGISEDEVSLEALGDLATRVRFRGWRSDYLELITAADVLVDSYPGGGVFMMEAMSLGLPVVSFDHDYVSTYSNAANSAGPEIVGIPELLLKHGDIESFRNVLSMLIRDEAYRLRMGEECRQRILRTRGDPARMVRRCEEIYERVVEERRGRHHGVGIREASLDLSGPELDERKLVLMEHAAALNRREAELDRRAPRWKARLAARVSYPLRRAWNKSRLWRRLREVARRF